MRQDRDAAILWAREMLETDFVILDTETTGLEDDDEAVQVGIVDKTGRVLLDTLVKPSKPIPINATGIHGIDDDMVRNAPEFRDIYPRLVELCNDKALLIYNFDYDWRILTQSIRASFGLDTDNYDELIRADEMAVAICPDANIGCVMTRYAEFFGEFNPRFGTYRWQRLTAAALHFGISIDGAHGAAADALMTLRVLEGMARARTSEEEDVADKQETIA